ncbi:uncharacterized protein NDAI_0H03870 [Naumovozyma dairenensis CBS 421]|uniref:Uncharacterized protein n=1 Tax=Naumovozyma dairenensis (strain ATCC 10597 / BCRC 20456 / CBS 421 / NBRC 0211 / NRRL Y-12639) TaxID=1071378 RepID=G0WFJ9_NAUDC|nr:hypothetical protein NDAI_0H03870 [Naumovozyma dairenensis CBS 421]CCD26560.1 hypothetical protein NDAI_0H03870 [Naumovozyma dairenensis CBS 421]
MDDLDFTDIVNKPPLNVYQTHRSLLDVFVINCYQLLTQNSIINTSSLFNSSTPPAQNSIVITPLSNTTDVPSSSSNNMDIGLSSSAALNGESMNASPITLELLPKMKQDLPQIFMMMSQIYNAMVSTVATLNTSPKSGFELFQRFQQIIKELELSFEVSPYNRYFNKLDERNYSIKERLQLQDDELFQKTTSYISTVYDLQKSTLYSKYACKNNNQTKQLPRKIANTNVGATKTFTTTATTINNTNIHNTNTSSLPTKNYKNRSRKDTIIQNNKINKPGKSNWRQQQISTTNYNNNDNILFNPMKNAQPNLSLDSTIPIGTLDPSLLDVPFSKKSQALQQDFMNSKAINGYYTQPTSPGGLNLNFGDVVNDPSFLENNTRNNDNTNNAINLISNGNITTNIAPDDILKRRSLGTLDVCNLDETTVEEFLQLTNDSKKNQRTENDLANTGQNNKSNNNNNNNTDESNTNSANTGNVISEPSSSNKIDKTTSMLVGSFNVEPNCNTASLDNNNEKGNNRDYIRISGMNSNDQLGLSIQPSIQTGAHLEIYIQALKNSYGKAVQEKDNRIAHLQQELENERQEAQWLRRVLIEDMAYIKGDLNNIKK